MAFSTSITLIAAAAALLSTTAEAGLYPKSSAVLSITGKTYESLIAQSNHTSIVEFYAPWCGHCKNLQPAYEKAAQKLKGLAKVAAIDCDEETNKPFCGSMGVQGFPTLKIVRPGKKPGRPVVEDYQGPRTAKGIADAVVEKIPNHVQRVGNKNVDGWLKEGNATAKAILFSDKGTTSALLRALAVDFLGSVGVAQIRDKDTEAVKIFGVEKYPTFVVLPEGDKEAVVYEGELKKDAMSTFITTTTGVEPNPDPALKDSSKKKTKSKDDAKAKKSFSKASASHKSEDASSEKLKATSITLEEEPTASPDPQVDTPKPVELPDIPAPLRVLESDADLQSACLAPKSGVCVLALLLSSAGDPASEQVLTSLAAVQHKLAHRRIFPFYGVSSSTPLAAKMRQALSLKGGDQVEVIATNAKRGWVRKYTLQTFGAKELEEWIDSVKMNEGAKVKLEFEDLAGGAATGSGAAPAEPPAEPRPEDVGEDTEKSPVVEEPEEPVEAPEVVTEGPIVVEETEAAEAKASGDVRDEL